MIGQAGAGSVDRLLKSIFGMLDQTRIVFYAPEQSEVPAPFAYDRPKMGL